MPTLTVWTCSFVLTQNRLLLTFLPGSFALITIEIIKYLFFVQLFAVVIVSTEVKVKLPCIRYITVGGEHADGTANLKGFPLLQQLYFCMICRQGDRPRLNCPQDSCKSKKYDQTSDLVLLDG